VNRGERKEQDREGSCTPDHRVFALRTSSGIPKETTFRELFVSHWEMGGDRDSALLGSSDKRQIQSLD
jgi:hypothetical protein